MEGNGEKAEKFSLAELKTDQADVCSALERIEDGSCRDVIAQKLALNFVVQHHEILPFGRKENLFFPRHLIRATNHGQSYQALVRHPEVPPVFPQAASREAKSTPQNTKFSRHLFEGNSGQG